MSDGIPIERLLEVAKETILSAGEMLKQEYHTYFVEGKELEISTKSSPIDFVTVVDGKTQEFVISAIAKYFPEHRFICEEEGADGLGAPDCPYEWIVDPLDGTRNFISGRKNFGSILAVQKDGELLAGAMIMPFLDELYLGAKGLGATFNGKTAKLRETKGMTDAVLCSNSIRRAIQGDDGNYYIPTPYCASLENYGCAVQEIGEMIQGTLDGVFFDGIRIWDIAAGFLQVQEAGGKIRYEWKEPGNVRSGLLCVASTEPIFEELCHYTFEVLPNISSISVN